jgi:hypothetical protein
MEKYCNPLVTEEESIYILLHMLKKGALDSQPQVIKFTSCLPRVSGSLWVLWLESSTNKTGHHDIAEIGIKTPKNQSNQAVITNNSLFSTQGFEP